jgi:hypothetical protein
MAYVRNPLHSRAARGQVGKSAIFQTYHGRTYAKAYAVPGNTPGATKMNQSPAQLALQATTKELMQAWPALTEEQKASWDALAKPKEILRVNAYLKYNFCRLAVGLPTTPVYPPATTETHGVLITEGATPFDPTVAGHYDEAELVNGRKSYSRREAPPRYIWWGGDYTIWVLTNTAPYDLLGELAEGGGDEPTGDYYPTLPGPSNPVATAY